MHRAKRKVSYVPGLLSLTCLFFACYFYLNIHGAFKQQSMIEVSWWNPRKSFFMGLDPYNPQPTRNYITYKLTGQVTQDRETLKLAQAEIRKQKLQNDTIKGVHFYFEEKAKYWSFVKAFDICLQEDANIVLPFQNDIWIFNFPQPKGGTITVCDIRSQSWDHLIIEKSEAQKRKEIAFIISALQQYWPSFLLFLLFPISILQQNRRNITW